MSRRIILLFFVAVFFLFRPSLVHASFMYPVNNYVVTTYFSVFHPGVDFATDCGTPIHATNYGVVSYDGWDTTGYGNRVDDYKSDSDDLARYGHLSEIDVSPGQAVVQGQLIGLVGTTGNSTGCHLHFELHWQGMAVDPFSSLSQVYGYVPPVKTIAQTVVRTARGGPYPKKDPINVLQSAIPLVLPLQQDEQAVGNKCHPFFAFEKSRYPQQSYFFQS